MKNFRKFSLKKVSMSAGNGFNLNCRFSLPSSDSEKFEHKHVMLTLLTVNLYTENGSKMYIELKANDD